MVKIGCHRIESVIGRSLPMFDQVRWLGIEHDWNGEVLGSRSFEQRSLVIGSQSEDDWGMTRKILIDADPGIDDALALTLALFCRDVDVLAITAVAGNVPAAQANRNVQTVIEQLDPPRFPRLGFARDEGRRHGELDSLRIHGDDGLGNSDFAVAELHHSHPSEKLITDLIRDEQEDLTLLSLGPLTNVARVLQTEPALAARIGRLVMMGGSVVAGGNITAAAEFNIYCDPESARLVFRSPMTKTLVPLDISRQLIVGLDLLDELPRSIRGRASFYAKYFRSFIDRYGSIRGWKRYQSTRSLPC